MKPSRAFLTLSTFAITFSLHAVAKAQTGIGLSFELQDRGLSGLAQEPTAQAKPSSAPLSQVGAGDMSHPKGAAAVHLAPPLPIPSAAINPPVAGETGLSSEAQGGGQALALNDSKVQPQPLPDPPALSSPAPLSTLQTGTERVERDTAPLQFSTASTLTDPIDDVLLQFGLQRSSAPATPPVERSKNPLASAIQQLFQGGSESLVARAVGSAEGTRTPEGHRTPAYFGHVDPGNQVWNLGTFSYQHQARTPEEADQKQLHRLERQTKALKQRAQAQGLELSLEELLNGIDLANQAPLAALDRMGYVDWLAQAHDLGMNGPEAITWARTRSFIDPDTQRWNAPGLGNNIHSISRDQDRRVRSIAAAIEAYPPSSTAFGTISDAMEEPSPKNSKDLPEPAAIALLFDQAFLKPPSSSFPTAEPPPLQRLPTDEVNPSTIPHSDGKTASPAPPASPIAPAAVLTPEPGTATSTRSQPEVSGHRSEIVEAPEAVLAPKSLMLLDETGTLGNPSLPAPKRSGSDSVPLADKPRALAESQKHPVPRRTPAFSEPVIHLPARLENPPATD